jgi:hypothetical protein
MFDPDIVNGIAGVAALVNSLVLVPSVMALRKIAKGHDERIVALERKKPAKKKKVARGR